MRFHRVVIFWGLFAICLGYGLVFAQTNSGNIAGTVMDQSHGVIPNAHVRVRNTSTGIVSTAKTDSGGRFAVNYLLIGTYSVTVEAAGFKTLVRKDLQLAAGRTLNLDLTLTVGAVKQTVTVSGAPPLLNTTSAEQHSTLGSADVHQLPLAHEDWTGLLQLGNGVQGGKGAQGDAVALNGLAPESFNLTVDGTNSSADMELPAVGFYQGFNVINTVNTDAIAEVSVTKGIAPASASGMSGNINIITKSGTNHFHGDLFEYNDVSALNARNQFLTTKPRTTFNEFGGAIGGPIIRNKLFFFGDYEGARNYGSSVVSGDVPTPQFIQQIQAVAPEYSSVLAAFPAPNQPYSSGSVTGRFVGSSTLIQKDSNAVARLDYYIDPANSLTLRVTRLRPFKFAPNLIAINRRRTVGHSQVYNAQFTHTAGPWTASTRFGYNWLYLDRLDEGFGSNLAEIAFSGFDSQGAENYQTPGGMWTWQENVAMVHGNHSIEFGGILQRNNTSRIDDTTNTYDYSTLSDFLANIPDKIEVNFLLTRFELHMYQEGGFVQDNWRFKPNLTLNLGLRYDYWTVPKEANGRLFNRNWSPLGYGTGSLRPPGSLYNASWPNFGPRLGFAWSLGSARKTVIRGGTGIFFGPHNLFAGPVDDVLDNPYVPFRLTLGRSAALAMGLNYPVDKQALEARLTQAGQPTATSSISPHLPNPYSMQWTLGIERDLGHGLMLGTSYVGNRGLNLTMIRIVNEPNRLTGVVPDPALGEFRYYDGSDSSTYNAWQTTLEERSPSGLNFGVNFTWAKNTSYGDADLNLNHPAQDNNNLRADLGPTPYSILDNFSANFVYPLPFQRLTHSTARYSRLLIGGWQISGIFTAQSGLPVNILNGNSSYPADRPDVVSGVNPYFGNYTSTLQYLNPAAFAQVPLSPASGAQIFPGNLQRYGIRAPGMWNFDFALAKNMTLSERFRLQVRGDFFNAFNHTNLSGLRTNISSSSFGQLTSATARTIQLGARLEF